LRIKPFFPLLLLFAFVISCAARKADFKSDAYFDGLQALKNGQKVLCYIPESGRFSSCFMLLEVVNGN